MRRTRRIYYGPEGKETSMWWTVKVSDARKSVKLRGDLLHALRGTAGVTIGCGLSNMAMDKANSAAFPHPCLLAAFTKGTALIVDKVSKDGSPAHAVLYAHSYPHITLANDRGELKKLVLKNPALMQRQFTLRPPRKHHSPPGANSGTTSGEKRGTFGRGNFVPRGALARAVAAGRIGQHVASQLNNMVGG